MSAPAAPTPETVPAEAAAGPDCAVCGAAAAGPFCHACGERRPHPDDERLAAFLREQFHEVTSADGRLWRSAKGLFVPGWLTEEYFAGRRGLYVRPVRLFLVVNIVFFLWIGVMGGQAFRGDAGLYRSSPAFDARMTEAAAAAGVEADVYDAAFSQRAQTLAPTLIAVFVPLYALVLALVLAPARPSALRHVVFATHFVAAFMASTVVLTALLALPVYLGLLLTGDVWYALDDRVIVPSLVVAWAAYLVVGVRRAYAVPWWGAVASGLAVALGGTYVVLEVYRRVLFFVTLWTLDVPA